MAAKIKILKTKKSLWIFLTPLMDENCLLVAKNVWKLYTFFLRIRMLDNFYPNKSRDVGGTFLPPLGTEGINIWLFWTRRWCLMWVKYPLGLQSLIALWLWQAHNFNHMSHKFKLIGAFKHTWYQRRLETTHLECDVNLLNSFILDQSTFMFPKMQRA